MRRKKNSRVICEATTTDTRSEADTRTYLFVVASVIAYYSSASQQKQLSREIVNNRYPGLGERKFREIDSSLAGA
ncbi:Hypothetical predicted protein [Octopus vulgaris]|uniref:Uncharacterized protein n=1 Tax=Octopus vulgaris TaxID=6645 RepID=A0AA36BBU3_OCTVU|nr:Hypothetical predicted protein [Octopus vulgaris]